MSYLLFQTSVNGSRANEPIVIRDRLAGKERAVRDARDPYVRTVDAIETPQKELLTMTEAIA